MTTAVPLGTDRRLKVVACGTRIMFVEQRLINTVIKLINKENTYMCICEESYDLYKVKSVVY